MSAAGEPLRRIAIVGGGQVAILTAIGLKRAVPGCEVVVLVTQGDPRDFADHAASALPFSNRLHHRLGITEDVLIGQAGGSHRLILRYIGWGGAGQHGAMAYGSASGVPQQARFAAQWGGGSRSAGAARAPGSLAEVLANAGRFAVHQGEGTGPVDKLDYAMRWDPAAYRALLSAEAQRIGVRLVSGGIARVEMGAGGVAAISSTQGERMTADLYVDCSGIARSVIGAHPEAEWREGTERTLYYAPLGQGMLALEDRLSLLPEGWLLELASRSGLQTILGARADIHEEAAARALQTQPAAKVALHEDAVREPWIGNVIAIGDAAACMEPLAFLPIDLAHRMLDLLLELLPGRIIDPRERSEFNRRARLMLDGVHESLALHRAAPFARQVFAGDDPPDAVLSAIDQYTRRGRLPFREEYAFEAEERIGLYEALGFTRGIPPQERSGDARHVAALQAEFERSAKAALAQLPPYGQWMMQRLGARQA
ncbi:hypothetical protein E3U23_08655 [Erythrobacter litoralis]|uniref:tryptophan 7-halogenase n=1 Tax=Erythrobacter litoralis TaxID=39960 RepID=UPI0024357DA1|nr:tryptophan 7-halogenase [Erythrobacter litoralis]MDG6079262.1 hypothetical protein [Erythrobacter litoralis]